MYDVEEAPGGEQYNTAGQVDCIYVTRLLFIIVSFLDVLPR